MRTYDWIVVGGGLTGSALSYELAHVGFDVLLVEQDASANNATRYSYGGIAYWSGTTDLTRQLCQEGIARHRVLSDELDSDTQFRELDLLLTIDSDREPHRVAKTYDQFAIAPTLLSVDQACEMEPLLNRAAIAGALHLKHGSVNPEWIVNAYNQAFMRAGGTIEITTVTGLNRTADRVCGVTTSAVTYEGNNVVICAGGMSRALLHAAGITVCNYFTHSELIETPPVDLRLQTIVMPAELQRFALEGEAGKHDTAMLWSKPGYEITAPIMDAGAIQLSDGRLRLGQISRMLTDVTAEIDAAKSEAWLRSSVGRILPALENLPGRWCRCLVAFSGDRLPLVGMIPGIDGLHIFSGFSNPFAILPPIARRYAHFVAGQADEVILQLSLDRFE
ncbi:FAD-binding oxidoreductase [Oculatella sp. LEGE 06141]|uniref:NAD(P)/FAD-dependent oxidoreductase n=1 Tax=Oculatella sp. LEGE 06141 TaxID=1828648 RepID=UPI001882ACF0|nr:FAD-binding oxidoreductase [Oculatella sp. LEGE 06141]MBE9177439.1 FAD-binding oxidoreductase [Oculatella sp. LEGE 06141]